MRNVGKPRRGRLARVARIPASYVWVSLLVFAAHVLGKHSDYQITQGVLAGIGGVVVALVLLSMFRARKQHMPILEWSFLQYYIFWISPVFFEGESTELVTFSVLRRTGELTRALLAILLFMGSVLAGYGVMKRVLPKRRESKPSPPISERALIVLAAISLIASYQILLRENEALSYYYLVFVTFSPTLFLIMFVYERANYRSSTMFNMCFYLFIIGAVVVGLTSGRLTFALLPFLVVVLTSLARSKQVHLGYSILVVAMIVLLNPAKIIYRDLAGFRTDQFAHNTLSDNLQALSHSMEVSWGENESVDRNMEGLANRLDEQTKTAVVFHIVPDIVRFEGGSTIWPFFWNMIPRMLWKDKPNTTHATADYFNIKLGFQNPRDTLHTTESMPMVADAYFNFGWAGVPALGIVTGIFLAVISWLFVADNRLFYVATFYVVVRLEVHRGLVPAFGGVWKAFFVAAAWCVILQLVASRTKRRVPTGRPPNGRVTPPSTLDRSGV